MSEYIPFTDSKLTDNEWDKFVDDSDNGTLFHKREFLSYHPAGRFKDASFVFMKNNKPLSLLTAAVVEREGKKILVSHPGASYGSFVYKSDLNFREAHSMVDALIEYANELNVNRIQLTLPPVIYQTKYSNYIDFALVRNGFTYLKEKYRALYSLILKWRNFYQLIGRKQELP